MASKTRTLIQLVIGLQAAVALGACAVDTGTTDPLGIARFSTTEETDRTTIIGYDDLGNEVGHLAIVHGVFEASPRFAPDFAQPFVDGRKLDAQIAGQTITWETEGFDPTLSLPAVDPRYRALGGFLEEGPVAAVLARWGIGFEAFVPTKADGVLGDGETAYASQCPDGSATTWYTLLTQTGTNPWNGFNTTTVSLPNNPVETANTCGGTEAATEVARITATIGGVSQHVIFQICDFETTLWKKTCPNTGSTASQCGSTTGACKGCPLVAMADGDVIMDVGIDVTSTYIRGKYYGCPQ